MLGDLNAYNPLKGSERISTKGKTIMKLLHKFSLICLNNTEETYYIKYVG